ncbi:MULTISPECIES: serine hydrolase [unclassified Rhizobium]|uniref:serine hydrolase domain-containing protein n=1 Tax=unclassified Rhizobium TaxID=2613769 RepID=UPI0016159053|nr:MULTISPECIES: serine hydrolase [unclassified Rhizobium]MBB3318839.1 CubicO group peptidase (beta-lactamase class C family) [Rhizobium sp. BK181]MCS3742387.1 CubicO group peptidase (beta-lactamase class C family) [Rhizobium sp. BK661]MCS4094785.1 CubicO group peptidase (beta-lactamase class C family) [Rhizobium sp. BK176]
MNVWMPFEIKVSQSKTAQEYRYGGNALWVFRRLAASLIGASLLTAPLPASAKNATIHPPPQSVDLPRGQEIGDITYQCDGKGPATCHLADFMTRAKVCALIVVKADAFTFEKYDEEKGFCRDDEAPPNGPTKLYGIASVTKSITSTLLGHVLSVKRGARTRADFDAELSQPVVQYIPELANAIPSGYSRATVDQVLRMQSGVWWSEYGWYGFFPGAVLFDKQVRTGMTESVIDFAHRFILRSGPPRNLFNYSALDAAIAAAVADRMLGETRLTDFFEKGIWASIGAEQRATWGVDNTGLAVGPCCFKATLRDLARFGLFVLNQGRDHSDRQIVPQAWFDLATKPSSDPNNGIAADNKYQKTDCPLNYGYFWWLTKGTDFTAVGRDGQFIHIYPDSKTVIVQISDWKAWTNGDALECEAFRAHDALVSATAR